MINVTLNRHKFQLAFILTILLTIVVFSSKGVEAQNVHGVESKVIMISGEMLQACVIAYADFSEIIKQYAQNKSTEVQVLSKIENYNIEISERDNTYIVSFSKNVLRLPYWKGGPVEYVIDKKNFEILEKNAYK